MVRAYHRHCIVYDCLNSTISTANKHFFAVPKKHRQKWLDICGNSYITRKDIYICEDHFNIPDDFVNWHEFEKDFTTSAKLRKRARFRRHVTPHIKVPRPVRPPSIDNVELLYPQAAFESNKRINTKFGVRTNGEVLDPDENSPTVSTPITKINFMEPLVSPEEIETNLKTKNSATDYDSVLNRIPCRFCLKEFKTEEEMVDIFSQRDSDIMWLCKISEISIDRNDNITRKICAQCRKSTNDFFQFIQKINEANNILKRSIENFKVEEVYLKSEIPESLDTEALFEDEDIDNLTTENETKSSRISDNSESDNNSSQSESEITKPTKLKRSNLQTVSVANKSSDSEYTADETSFSEFEENSIALETRSNSKPSKKRKVEKKQISCLLCSQKFTTKNFLKVHMVSHGEKSIKCPQCPEMFYTGKLLSKHVVLKHEYIKNKYVCTVSECGKTCLSSKALKSHRNLVHGTENVKESFLCHICSKSFTKKFSLNKHLENHEALTETFRCQICESVFSTKYRIQRHLQLHGKGGELSCNICKKIFRRLQELKVHMSTIHIDGMPPGCSTEQCAERKTRNCRMFTEEIRRKIFENFWAIQDREKRKIFLLENIDSINVLRRRTKNYSMRNFTNNYFLPIGDRRLQIKELPESEEKEDHSLPNEDSKKFVNKLI